MSKRSGRLQFDINESSSRWSFLKNAKAAFVIGALSMAVIGGGGYYLISNLEDSSVAITANLQDKKVAEIVDEVKKMLELPDEDPQIATVSDVEKLKEQVFFADAQNGDLVLIYNSTQKAVLYRPTTKKIINYSLITMPTGQPTASQGATTTPSVAPKVSISPTAEANSTRVVILNGTKEKGLAKKAQDLIQKAGITVVLLSNTKGDYATSSVSNVSKTKKFTDKELQDVVSGITKTKLKPISLPSVETTPANTDVVIIVGEDFAKQY